MEHGGYGCTSRTSPPTCAPRSLIDREAYRRGTSVYVPDAVEPMLPEALSNQRVLVGSRARIGWPSRSSVVLENDRVRHSSFYRSVIRSDERLDYERVDRIFAGVERSRWRRGGRAWRRAGGGRGA